MSYAMLPRVEIISFCLFGIAIGKLERVTPTYAREQLLTLHVRRLALYIARESMVYVDGWLALLNAFVLAH
jgi:hypothetical protein